MINSYTAEAFDGETGEERNDHFATFETRQIIGVGSAVVRDTALENGLPIEDALDWYAQDADGNVWYLGEIAVNYNYNDEDEFTHTDFGDSWDA